MSFDRADFESTVGALRAIAEPTRLRIIALLRHGECSVSDLCEILGQSQPRISRHLRLLGESGLITRHREGTWAFHRLTVNPSLTPIIDASIPDDEDAVLRSDLEPRFILVAYTCLVEHWFTSKQVMSRRMGEDLDDPETDDLWLSHLMSVLLQGVGARP